MTHLDRSGHATKFAIILCFLLLSYTSLLPLVYLMCPLEIVSAIIAVYFYYNCPQHQSGHQIETVSKSSKRMKANWTDWRSVIKQSQPPSPSSESTRDPLPSETLWDFAWGMRDPNLACSLSRFLLDPVPMGSLCAKWGLNLTSQTDELACSSAQRMDKDECWMQG